MDKSKKPSSKRVQQLAERQPDHIGLAFWRVYTAFEASKVRQLNAQGFDDLSPGLIAILAYLDVGGSRLADIARRANISKQGAHKAIQNLVKRGYLESVPDPADQRGRIFRYSERGLNYLEAAQAEKIRLHKRVEKALGKTATLELDATLRRISELLDKS